MKVAVIAHRRKSVGGGRRELRELLARQECFDPLWFEVAKGKTAGKKARKAVKAGADLLVVWGGDGTVRSCLNAAAGLDAEMIDDAGRKLKRRLGQAAYVWTALRHVRDPATTVRLTVDGEPWFTGPAGCVLSANVSRLTGGVRAFPEAVPDDGLLEVGVTTAEGMVQWARTAGRLLTGHAERSPLVHTTRARRCVKAGFAAPMRYELDGGDRRRVTPA